MDTEERQQFEEKIKAAIITTEENIATLEELTKPIAPDNAIGRLTRMEALSSKSVNEATLITARHRLGKLKHVIANLDGEEFGICIDCGEPIPMARIFAMPESTHCVKCAD